MGAVRLVTTDIDRMSDFYEKAIGLEPLGRAEGVESLGIDGAPLVELVEKPDALPKPYGTTGLFHLAILVPSRSDLARAIRRVVTADWTFTGASDHIVSEAMYLDDPEGNGIEIYRDRNREEWGYDGDQLLMGTLPLDIDGVLGEAEPTDVRDRMASGTRMGHVHLQVADIAAAEEFYAGILGFDVMVRGYPGALFVSAGGYHHHLGLNTWAGEGAPPPPPEARGLARYEIRVPDRDSLASIEKRLRDSGVETAATDEKILTADPFSNSLLIRAD